MKSSLVLATILLPAASLHAVTIPSDGSDGNFHPTETIEIDLSQAITGPWDQNNAAHAGKGIYDPEKWAVVFKYNSVTIPAGVTVTFKNHATRAPVIWLVQGNTSIAGTVDLDGKTGSALNSPEAFYPSEPGPGGFRGGPQSALGFGQGLGPGGGGSVGSSGQYATRYGNPAIIPLIGGSGSSASNSTFLWFSGSAGGGAILIASPEIEMTGTVQARGGIGHADFGTWASGGAIKLIANRVSGNGILNASHDGRIRVESPDLSPAITMTPETIAVPPADPPILWPGEGAPTVRIVSIAGQSTPADPTAPLQAASDVGIAHNEAVQVVVETTDFPPSGVVQIRHAAKFGEAAWTTLAHTSGDFTHSTWTASILFPGGYTTLQAHATVP